MGPHGGMSRQMILLAGNSHPELAQSVAQRLGIPLGSCQLFTINCGDDSDEENERMLDPLVYSNSDTPQFNQETKIQIGESVRGKDCFILQTGTQDPNNMMMELFIMAYACKTSCAHRIVGVVPYLPYSKQCRMRKRGSIPCQLFANMMVKAGIQHLITMDLHMKEIQGFFPCPVDNLRASSFLIQELKDQRCAEIGNGHPLVVVARHPGQARRATAYAERLRTGLVVIHGGERFSSENEDQDGRSSPPPLMPPGKTPSPQTPSKAGDDSTVDTSEGDVTGGQRPISPVANHAAHSVHFDYSSNFAFPSTTIHDPSPPPDDTRTPDDTSPGTCHCPPGVVPQPPGLATPLTRARSLSEGPEGAMGPLTGNGALAGSRGVISAVGSRPYEPFKIIPSLTAKKKPPITVVGDVQGKTAIIVEDMIDDVDGFCAAARFLKEAGACSVKVMCTHGLLSDKAIKRIKDSSIDELIITNTIPNEQGMSSSKIKVVDVSGLISEGIRRIHHGESMSYLFRDMNPDD